MLHKNQDKISVIVAIYNTESYLQKCIDSIINQTYNNLEIFLVDDGSNDTSPQICDEYQKLDKRIKVIHKINGGQGSARNMALDLITGDYIGFVDSDDWIEKDIYEFMLNVAQKENADIVECGWNKVNLDNKIEFVTKEKYYSLDKEQAMYALVYGTKDGVNTSVCNKIFKKDCIGLNRFPEVRAYEDDEWIHKVVWSASKIMVTGAAKYYYYSRSNSTMTAKFNLNKLALLTVQSNICDFLYEYAPQYFHKAHKTLCSKQFYIISCLLKNPELDRDHSIVKQIEQNIWNTYSSYMKNPEIGRNKFILLLFRFLPVIGRVVIKSKF